MSRRRRRRSAYGSRRDVGRKRRRSSTTLGRAISTLVGRNRRRTQSESRGVNRVGNPAANALGAGGDRRRPPRRINYPVSFINAHRHLRQLLIGNRAIIEPMTTVGRPLPSQSSAAHRVRRGGADSPTSAASPLAINAISAINTLRFTIAAHATIGHRLHRLVNRARRGIAEGAHKRSLCTFT